MIFNIRYSRIIVEGELPVDVAFHVWDEGRQVPFVHAHHTIVVFEVFDHPVPHFVLRQFKHNEGDFGQFGLAVLLPDHQQPEFVLDFVVLHLVEVGEFVFVGFLH